MISDTLKSAFLEAITFDPIQRIATKREEQLPVDYFAFYQAISSVYSSKIEGENIDFDSFYKHKFLGVKYQSDYTKRSEDLFSAYVFIQKNPLTHDHVFQAHRILSKHLLPASQRGKIRTNPMFVINEDDRIEYVACAPEQVQGELNRFFNRVADLLATDLSALEVFFYAAQIHLVFVKIHPLQDGNGRTARLLEKWFLLEKLGPTAVSVELEKNYYTHRKDYYRNIRKIGLEYQTLDYSQALNFLLMTVNSLR